MSLEALRACPTGDGAKLGSSPSMLGPARLAKLGPQGGVGLRGSPASPRCLGGGGAKARPSAARLDERPQQQRCAPQQQRCAPQQAAAALSAGGGLEESCAGPRVELTSQLATRLLADLLDAFRSAASVEDARASTGRLWGFESAAEMTSCIEAHANASYVGKHGD